MKKAIPPKNVNEYLSGFPADVKAALAKVRKAIRQAAPDAEEVISFHIPTYNQLGPLVCFGGYENHCSFYTKSKDIIKIFARELEEFKAAGITIHFTPEKPLPVSLIQKIVKLRIRQNEESRAAKEIYGRIRNRKSNAGSE